MRYGAMNSPLRALPGEVERIARLGFDYLELAMDPPEAHHTTLRRFRRDLSAALTANGLGLVCHLPTFVYTADLTPAIREASLAEVRASLETAAELGARKVVLHPSAVSGLGAFVLETVRAYAHDSLAQIADAGERLGLTVCLENMFPRYGAYFEPDEFIPLLAAFPRLSLTLDIGHAHIGDPSGRRAEAFLRACGTRLGHVHLSDNHGRYDDHLPLGAGRIDLARWVRALAAAGYDRTVTFEIFSGKDRDLSAARRTFEALRGGR